MVTGLNVLHELKEAKNLADWAANYAQTAPNADPECWLRLTPSIAETIEGIRAKLNTIESKLAKPQEVRHGQAA